MGFVAEWWGSQNPQTQKVIRIALKIGAVSIAVFILYKLFKLLFGPKAYTSVLADGSVIQMKPASGNVYLRQGAKTDRTDIRQENKTDRNADRLDAKVDIVEIRQTERTYRQGQRQNNIIELLSLHPLLRRRRK